MNPSQPHPTPASCPDIPVADQELVFNAPWEAKAFAIVNHLAKEEHYTWSEWTQYLVNEIASAEQQTPDSLTYYEKWVMACEKLLADKGLLDAQAISAKIDALMAEKAAEHPH